MEIDKILNADILDIIFEGRNKEYGAYDLRKTYNWRLVKALGGVVLLLVSLVMGYVLSNVNKGKTLVQPVIDCVLRPLPETVKSKPLLPPPPRPRTVQPRAATIPLTVPRIVANSEEVKKDEKPPEQAELDKKAIGITRQDGPDDAGGPSPAVSGTGSGVVADPTQTEAEPDVFTKVEIESTYPGDIPAWQRYLNKNFHYPDEAISDGKEGTVVVRFIVDREGNVSDVEAISGPETGGLREEAVRVIKRSGRWRPAIQNGRPVKSYKSQPIVFKLEAQ